MLEFSKKVYENRPTTRYAELFPILVNTYFADRYFYINPKSHSPRYYKETDSNYHARIRKENSKHVHQEPYSLERIITGVYFVSFISLYENKFKTVCLECCFININYLV